MRSDFEMNGRDLDQELNSPAQIQVREVVRALPEETLSLTWRSDLNLRLRGEAARKRKRMVFGWVWKPTAGLALAGALAVGIFLHPATAPTNGGELEKALVNHYVEASTAREAAVDGVTPNEVKDSGGTGATPGYWDQEDVGATL
jgi:hypothetical protein